MLGFRLQVWEGNVGEMGAGGGVCGKRGEKIPTLLSINWRQGPVVVAVGSSGG